MQVNKVASFYESNTHNTRRLIKPYEMTDYIVKFICKKLSRSYLDILLQNEIKKANKIQIQALFIPIVSIHIKCNLIWQHCGYLSY